MKVHLKKPHLNVLNRAFDGDSIISPSTDTFYWREHRTRLMTDDFELLCSHGLMEWIDGDEYGHTHNEAVITQSGRELIEELGLSTYAYSR